jgi:hypothetical protein
MSSDAHLVSPGPDHLYYKLDNERAIFLTSPSCRVAFPRGLLCVAGQILRVREVQSDLPAPGAPAILKTICIPSTVEVLHRSSFGAHKFLSLVAFESDSHLCVIEDGSFDHALQLRSISIPPSVRGIPVSCFAGCESLSIVTFGPASQISRIERCAFQQCKSLSAICVPSSVARLCEKCFQGRISIGRHIRV